MCKESGAAPWCSNHPQAELAPAVGHGKIRSGGGCVCVCVCVCDRGQYAELVFSLKPSECAATAVGCRDLQVCMFVCGQNARPVFSLKPAYGAKMVWCVAARAHNGARAKRTIAARHTCAFLYHWQDRCFWAIRYSKVRLRLNPRRRAWQKDYLTNGYAI